MGAVRKQRSLSHQMQLMDLAPPVTAVSWFGEIMDSLAVELGCAWPDRFGAAMRDWLRAHGHTPIRTLSLFSGGGGLDIAFGDCGFEMVEMVEIEPKYAATLRANSARHGLTPAQVHCMDIRDYHPDLAVDFIVGGPPCQTFSAAGRRASGVLGTTDPRGTLFNEYVRMLKTLRPKGFLFENVYGITGAQEGEAWREIQAAFREAGYTIAHRVLDASDYGVPQQRERVFIVGFKDGTFRFPRPTHGPDSRGQQPVYTAGEAVQGADDEGIPTGIGGQYGHLLDGIPPGLNYSFYTKEMGHPNPVFSWRSKFSDFLYKADPDMPARTVKAQGGQYTGPFHWENRRFSLAEFKRLQTFPDAYDVIGGRQVAIEQIGNSVPPQIGRILALGILEQLFGVALPFPMHYLSGDDVLGFRKRKRLLTERYAATAQQALVGILSDGSAGTMPHVAKRADSIRRHLGASFEWSERDVPDSTALRVAYETNPHAWQIFVGLATQPDDDPEAFTVTVRPAPGETWVIPAPYVRLVGAALREELFVGVWKAFEEHLRAVTGKADLVQLSGYYQYTPNVTADLSFPEGVDVVGIWRVFRSVVRGIGVRRQLPLVTFAELWGVAEPEVLDHLHTLRRNGYEVRSQNTNPQIAEGMYLVPYAFPTLTPRSVQLRKTI